MRPLRALAGLAAFVLCAAAGAAALNAPLTDRFANAYAVAFLEFTRSEPSRDSGFRLRPRYRREHYDYSFLADLCRPSVLSGGRQTELLQRLNAMSALTTRTDDAFDGASLDTWTWQAQLWFDTEGRHSLVTMYFNGPEGSQRRGIAFSAEGGAEPIYDIGLHTPQSCLVLFECAALNEAGCAGRVDTRFRSF